MADWPFYHGLMLEWSWLARDARQPGTSERPTVNSSKIGYTTNHRYYANSSCNSSTCSQQIRDSSTPVWIFWDGAGSFHGQASLLNWSTVGRLIVGCHGRRQNRRTMTRRTFTHPKKGFSHFPAEPTRRASLRTSRREQLCLMMANRCRWFAARWLDLRRYVVQLLAFFPTRHAAGRANETTCAPVERDPHRWHAGEAYRYSRNTIGSVPGYLTQFMTSRRRGNAPDRRVPVRI